MKAVTEHSRRATRWALSVLALAIAVGIASTLEANHPVLVEGEQDYDGDGLRGMLEDGDGDQVFGTLTAALGAAGANQNGRVVVVTSGRFQETLTITGAGGNVTLEGAPGVEADIDAVIGGSPANADAQTQPGIVVDAAFNRRITLRNLTIRNWTDGILVRGTSHVTIDGCRIENNIDHGIRFMGGSRGFVTDTQVTATGFRVSPVARTNAIPGVGIRFVGSSAGKVAFSEVSGSFAAGLSDESAGVVRTFQVTLFDNKPNTAGVSAPESSSIID